MPVSLNHHQESGYLEVLLAGKLDRQDYEAFVPQIEQLMREHGKLRLLVELRDFKGWTIGGLWEDIKFDARHFRDVERLAIVGERRWQEGMALFCKPFTTAKIRYFESFEIADAREWLMKGQRAQPASMTRSATRASSG